MARPAVATLGLAAVALPLLLTSLAAVGGAPPAPRVDFDRDVRPILSENCYTCHGPDTARRQAGLRFDDPAVATGKLPSGDYAIVPWHPERSMLVARITAPPAMRMPPQESGKHLSTAQIDTLTRWIAQGAHFEPHWAFVAPKRPALPAVKEAAWCRNAIDRFVLARLGREGLRPSPEADRATLIRRVSLDLTGLPPTVAEVDAFLADRQPGAYERVVDRLLASPHYGEHMATRWLDLARYADTHGYHIDSQRDMWPWRDWVIRAYNSNLPYDQFVVDQVAGDLLPNATLDQRIATGFNRNHPINFEGGAIPEEYAAAYVEDRVDATSTTFMGLTMKCGQCHDHKYDPITQREYYRFFAFFNSVPEQGLDGQKGNAAPFIKVPSPEQQATLDAYTRGLADAEAAMRARVAQVGPAADAWAKEEAARPLVPERLAVRLPLDEGTGPTVREARGKLPPATVTGKPDWSQSPFGGALALDGATYVDLGQAVDFDRMDRFSYGAWAYPTSGEAMTVVSKMDDADSFRGWDMYLSEGKVFVHLIHKWETNAIRVNTKAPVELNKWHHLFVTYDGSGKAKGLHLYVDGKSADVDVTHDTLTDTIRTTRPVLIGRRSPAAPFRGRLAELRLYTRALRPDEVARIYTTDLLRPALAAAPEKRTPEQRDSLARAYLQATDPAYRHLEIGAADLRARRAALDASVPTVMVMEEMPKPRDTFILLRGQYDQHGDKVTPGTPAVLPSLPSGMPPDRLALARWLVSPTHPLTARVEVNRLWQRLFGVGIVKTAENFGLQGERPSHPELLDWLATELIRTKWNVKGMLRLMVTSAAYRQSSRVSPGLLARDPENRLLARGPRFRLPAETVRDQALAIAGLLVDKVGGPSVKPYQPAGLWEEISFKGGFTAQYYQQDHGDALYRRSLYTFWKRTCPPPTLQTFDAPEREFCIVQRSATNTPLQALDLLNDPTFVEASRKFAELIMKQGGTTEADRVRYAFRRALCRLPRDAERDALLDVYHRQRARFAADNAAALKLLSVGESKRDEKLDPADLAAWSTVASIILNLDETITKG